MPDLPVIGALAEHYTVLDRYFCSFAGETFPNRFYQHAARTDRDHNTDTISTLPAIWDQLSPIPNTQGIPTGGYFFRDLPFLALWGTKYFPFWHPFAAGDTDALGIPVTTLSFLDTVAQGSCPTSASSTRPSTPRATGPRPTTTRWPTSGSASGSSPTPTTPWPAPATWTTRCSMVTFDEWGGFYDHVPPPRVIDDTNPADVDHTGDGTTPDRRPAGARLPAARFRVPAIVVSNLARRRVVHHGPFEHTSTLKLIESTFGLHPLTARDAHAQNLGQVLDRRPRRPVPAGAIPTSSQVLGPVSDAAAICSADSVQSVSPAPVRRGKRPAQAPPLSPSGIPSGAGMVEFGRQYRQQKNG